MKKSNEPELSLAQREQLFEVLKTRFEKHIHRHPDLHWDKVLTRLEAAPDKLRSLYEMEETGGEPDVVSYDKKSGVCIFFDCSPETPKGRRSLSYDREGQDSRKEHRPENNAIDLAMEMGIELLSEEQYRYLQQLGSFDNKTSSWLRTPEPIRKLGGAIFGDYRYGQVFIYHNGAASYYAVRGFRGWIAV
ncbi:DUF4256 domain-containing protein [Sphingobacterium spiritivorum]|uniref:DUF4256 domain-containing protein n=1 Tax=Sphingobacterium spiritivorum TaxID=258 RepID=UPI003DA38E06